jgi:hypothetical protein
MAVYARLHSDRKPPFKIFVVFFISIAAGCKCALHQRFRLVDRGCLREHLLLSLYVKCAGVQVCVFLLELIEAAGGGEFDVDSKDTLLGETRK